MILCAGDALIDMIPHETANKKQTYTPTPGGAVFNTAIALGRLGVETGFFSGLSDDFLGDILIKALNQSKVRSFAKRFNRPTTLAFLTLKEGEAQYSFYDENSAGRLLCTDDLPSFPPRLTRFF